jgi:exopolyphosphatase/guanosine-5'-triphosphate,3'-diphosphate pyrophosphatase
MNYPRLAAIDLGTNSFHLIIVEINPETGKFKILGREKENVRLGSSSTDMKYISMDAIRRGIDTLKRFKGLAESAGAPVRAIATSAVREALNRDDFINRVKTETGIRVETASGVEEARYIYLGVLQALPVFEKRVLLIDIGGGSTEFLIGYRQEILYDNSLKLGAIRLTQRFFTPDKLEQKAIKECKKYVSGYMYPGIRGLENFGYECAVGSSGTIVNIANIIRIKRGEDPDSRLNNFTFTKDELEEVTNEILGTKTIKERVKINGLDPERADIIPAGVIILRQIFKELKIKEMVVSEFALREGIIYDTIEKEMNIPGGSYIHDLRTKSVLHLAENYAYEKEHAGHTAQLALKLFDQTTKLHNLGLKEREYLEAAAVLHEIGSFVSHSQHHRHSYYLIRNSELLGFTENEKEIIANIARYHRKSHPKPKHAEFVKLLPEDQLIVRKLASILRIADGLDRTHNSAVTDIDCIMNEKDLTIRLAGRNSSPLDLEIWGGEMKKGLFEETFDVIVKFEVKNK